MNPIPAVANVRFADLVKRADGSPITSGTVNFYVYCIAGSNAGKWFRGSDTSWQSSESIAGAMTHLSDGHWYVSIASAAWTLGDIVLEYAEESGNLHTPISRQAHVEYTPGWSSAGKAPATVAAGDGADSAANKTTLGVAGAGLTALGDTRLANLDAAVSSRLATSGYTAPDNADVVLIKAKTDNLPASPAAVGSAMTLTSAYDAAKSAAAPGAQMDLVNAPNATAIAAIVAAVWAATTRTLSSFGTLVSDAAAAVWGTATRSLTDKAGFTISGTKTTLDALNDITAASVWSSTTRTLTSFGTLTTDTATAVWGAGTRALTDKAGFFISGTKTTLDALNDITASAVWANATRTLTSFGTLASDTATAVWGAGTRTLSSFGTLASDIWSYATRLLSTPPGDATAASQTTIYNAIGSLASQVAAIPTDPYTGTPPTAEAIRAELDANSTRLAKLDAPVSTRMAASAYAAPDNASIAAIKGKTDRLPTSPAAASDMPTPEENAAALLAATGVIGKLLKTAEERPLYERMLIRRGKDKGQLRAKVNERTKRAMLRLGRERAMFYRIAIYTGLRVSEVASLTLADLHLDVQPPHVTLHARHDKARRGARQPLPDDLALSIRQYLAARLRTAQENAIAFGTPAIIALPQDEPLIAEVPALRVFDRDLEMAGIEKKDQWGRTVDLHSLRHTFGTMLARSGVNPRTAMELMRHSDIRLTTNIYQHLELVDTAGAVNLLPTPKAETDTRATGTDATTA